MPPEQSLNKSFLLLLIAVSIGFGWILWPFIGAVFWAVALAILFHPLYKRLLRRLPRSTNLAALITLVLCLLGVILPLVLIGSSVVNETVLIYNRMSSGQLDFGTYFQQINDAMPGWIRGFLERIDLASAQEIQSKLSSIAAEAGKLIAGKAVEIGQNTLGFVVSFGVMLYLLFFLLRDGSQLTQRIRNAIPLEKAHKQSLESKFATVIRATVKGNLVVAAAQGALGGIIFAILDIQGAVLWGVLMAFLSLLPAVGASLIWGPVSIYFIATGNVTQGLILAAYGVLVIGLVDNFLRPILVGKDTKLPDYIVLISTLGGMSIFGLTGFVIGPTIAALFLACWDIFSTRTARSE
ncbi:MULTISPECIES: AI-2E family transporter [Comamonas]|uniref:AI-2E family transporter n=1 Tax=Comamonas jiangduensis TaxID=1194168 RepID=A0ABV4IAU8_9BURK|nr:MULTISPECIES: AI-2E family transporter [Comamonas]